MLCWRGLDVPNGVWWVALHCCWFGVGCGQVSYRGGGIVLHNLPRADAGVRDARITQQDQGAVLSDARQDTWPTGGCGSALESEAFRLTNVARAAAGFAPLICDLTLVNTARAHSLDMCARRFFSHENPDGLEPDERMSRAGVRRPGAENIAAGQTTAQSVVNNWMQSSGHRAHILDPRLRSLGVGHAPCANADLGNFWTQNFAY